MIRTSFAALAVSGCLCMFALSSPVEVLQELNIKKSFERERGKQKIRTVFASEGSLSIKCNYFIVYLFNEASCLLWT